MIKVPEKIPQKKRIILGPLSRFLLKIFKWDITGEIPNLSKMVLIGAPHSAMRDGWYGLLAVLALDLKVTFYGASWIFTRLPSLITFSKNLDKLGIPWPLGWLQKIILIRLGGVPVYRVNSRGTIKAAIEKFSTMDNYLLLIAPEAGTELVPKFRSGFYYLAKELNIPYVPVEIDFKNRAFNIRSPENVTSSFEEESKKIISIFEGVEGATRVFTMSE
jgi:1-acyl-sn-glycerol-3-phosphate acyltransferase|tara:strand:- start:1175 stop:1828 length:654 start_codon:yes stop_codon:yes gene_type:complete